MKKVLSVIAAAAMLLSLTACKGKDTSSGAADLKTLRVGADVVYPPFEYFDTDGTTPIGIDVELSKALGEKLGCEVEIVNTAWDGIFAGLSKGDYDVVISAVTITPDRLLEFDFSDPYIENWQSIVTLSGADVKPADPSELAGLKVGYLEESTSDVYLTNYIAENGIQVETFEYATMMNAYDDLAAGRLDAVISDSTVATKYIADERFTQTWLQTDGEPEQFAVCMPKGSDDLKTKINTALAELKADGTLDSIFNTYF